MQYKVLKIEEDMDFGCEERQPGEALMSVVLMEDGTKHLEVMNMKQVCDMMTVSCTKEISMREILLPWTGSISCGNCKTEGTYIIGFCHDCVVCGYVH